MTQNIHLVVGDDDFLAERTARNILERVVKPEQRASAVETVDGAGANRDEQMKSLRACRASVETPPFLDPVKLTWWRGVDFLPTTGKAKISEEVKDALEAFAKGIAAHPMPDNQHLLVTATHLQTTGVFAKTLVKAGAEVIVLPHEEKGRKREQMALAGLDGLAAELGLKFAPGAAQAFVRRVGTDTRTLYAELGKLRDYLGPGESTVTAAAIADISAAGSEPEFWEITAAIGARDPAKLMAVLAHFEDEDGFGIMITTVLERTFRQLIIVRDAIDRGWINDYGWSKTVDTAAAEALDATGTGPGTCNGWALSRLTAPARAYSLRELRVARFRMLAVRERLVSGQSPEVALVESELLRIVARPARRRP